MVNDPTADQIGIETVRQRDRSHRDDWLQTGLYALLLELVGVPDAPTAYFGVHVSTRKLVDTIPLFSSANLNVG